MIYPLALNSIRTGFFLKACCEFVFVFSLDGSCTFIAGHAPKCLSASFRHKIPKSSYLLFFILLAFSRALPYAGICLFYNLKANIGRVVLIWDHPFSSVFSMHSFLTPHAQAKLSTSLSLCDPPSSRATVECTARTTSWVDYPAKVSALQFQTSTATSKSCWPALFCNCAHRIWETHLLGPGPVANGPRFWFNLGTTTDWLWELLQLSLAPRL